jgi:hypothetical protein
MPRGPITSRPLIRDTDPNYSQYKIKYYNEHKAERAVHMKNYYEKNKEILKAKRKLRYHIAKANAVKLAATLAAKLTISELPAVELPAVE